jgi:hypothetical protein
MQVATVLMALGALTAAHAITRPIQAQRGIVRLGSKTQANVEANHSSVAMGQGMVLVSSNPGGLGRATLKVSFDGAPMVAKVQGTAVIAYLPGKFIEITEVEGRTYLTREGKLGENVAIDAGKMLLVEPTANRLPNTIDINLDYFVKNSPMLNGGQDLGASPLIARSIDKQSADRYLKPTPVYFNGAGTEAVVESGKGKPPPSSSYEIQPLNTSLKAIEVIEQLPRTGPEQLVASVSNTNAGGVLPGGEGPPSEAPPSQPPPSQPPPSQPPPSLPPVGVDVPGAPAQQSVVSNFGVDVPPSRGFLVQLHVQEDASATDWFPIDFTNADRQAIVSVAETVDRTSGRPNPQAIPPKNPPDYQLLLPTNIAADRIVGLVQGAQRIDHGNLNGFTNVVFKEAQIVDPQAANFKITSLGQNSSVLLKFSQDVIPSDILDRNQFNSLFVSPGGQIVGLDTQGSGIPGPQPIDIREIVSGKPVTQLQFNNLQPNQTVMISEPNFFAGDSPTMPPPPGTSGLGQQQSGPLPQKNGTLYGLTKPTFMGSVFVQPTGGGVSVEVGQRIERDVDPTTFQVTERLVNGGYTFEPLDPSDPKSLGFGVFSLQAPDPPDPSPSAAAEITAPIFRIESDGPLHISDPIFDPTTNISNLADAALIAKQDIAVQSVALQQIAQTISPTTAAQTVSLRLSAASIGKLTAGQDYWIKTPTANFRMTLQTIDKTNNTATFAAAPGVTVPNIPAGALIFDQDPSLHGQLVFHNTNLNAGQGIAISSPNKIRFENSSQIQAFTDVVMQGGGTADLELLQNSVVKANGQILLDQFRNITIDSTQLMAAVIKARVVSPTGALMINNSTLAAGSLLRLYAEGSNGTVAFSGSVNLTGKQIDIAGKTVVVQSGGKVMTSPNTTVYADTHNYNTGNFGTIKNAATNSNISSSQQKGFAARPPF